MEGHRAMRAGAFPAALLVGAATMLAGISGRIAAYFGGSKSAAEMARYLKSEIEKYGKIVRAIGLKID
jgi:hypothetical protein